MQWLTSKLKDNAWKTRVCTVDGSWMGSGSRAKKCTARILEDQIHVAMHQSIITGIQKHLAWKALQPLSPFTNSCYVSLFVDSSIEQQFHAKTCRQGYSRHVADKSRGLGIAFQGALQIHHQCFSTPIAFRVFMHSVWEVSPSSLHRKFIAIYTS